MTTQDVVALKVEAEKALDLISRAYDVAVNLDARMQSAIRAIDPCTEAGKAAELAAMGIIRVRTHLRFVAEKFPDQAFALWLAAVESEKREPAGFVYPLSGQVPA